MALQSTSTVGVREAKTRFYELLEKAKSGEEIAITKYGTPVARLIPLQDGRPGRTPYSDRALNQPAG